MILVGLRDDQECSSKGMVNLLLAHVFSPCRRSFLRLLHMEWGIWGMGHCLHETFRLISCGKAEEVVR